MSLIMSYVYRLFNLLFDLLSLAILARAFLSWFNVNPYHPAIVFLRRITDPILDPLRHVIPPIGGLDFSPIVALFLLQMVRRILLYLIGI